LSRYNSVLALSWGPAGFLIGGPFADFQTEILKVPTRDAYVNAFFVSSLLVLLGTSLFFAKIRRERHSSKVLSDVPSKNSIEPR